MHDKEEEATGKPSQWVKEEWLCPSSVKSGMEYEFLILNDEIASRVVPMTIVKYIILSQHVFLIHREDKIIDN